jgi:hypothetical protein
MNKANFSLEFIPDDLPQETKAINYLVDEEDM